MTLTDDGNEAQVRELLRKRERQCAVERKAYEIWMGVLTPIRWFTIGAGTILSTIAGSTLMTGVKSAGVGVLTASSETAWTAGLCALGSATLAALHVAFKCDAHQADCTRNIGVFARLKASFEETATLGDTKLLKAARDLESKYLQAIETPGALPPTWCRDKAELHVGTVHGAMRAQSA